MKMRSAVIGVVSVWLFAACKKTGAPAVNNAETGGGGGKTDCGQQVVSAKAIRAGETGIFLPAGTVLCRSQDELEIRVQLPEGYSFEVSDLQGKTLPVGTATYQCICSAAGTACKVFYADGWGFGCLQNSCSGSCTGKFIYKGYTVEKVLASGDKTEFFKRPGIREDVARLCEESKEPALGYRKLELYGVPFFWVTDVPRFLAAAKCNCEETRNCSLKTLSFGSYKIYYCEGSCNGCELTVS